MNSERGMKEPITSEAMGIAQAIQPSPTEAEVIDRKLQEAGVLMRLKEIDIKKHKAWRRGQTAKELGWVRISPYYEDDGADKAWFAGFDGKDEPTLDMLLVPVLNTPAV